MSGSVPSGPNPFPIRMGFPYDYLLQKKQQLPPSSPLLQILKKGLPLLESSASYHMTDTTIDEIFCKSNTLKAIHGVICSVDGENIGDTAAAGPGTYLLENALAALFKIYITYQALTSEASGETCTVPITSPCSLQRQLTSQAYGPSQSLQVPKLPYEAWNDFTYGPSHLFTL
ncbi:hypothetical protein CJ030_MR4G009609 [Morella rubra]|uniref:Uncharacterized protein n=1 Tax=Morella rubra TaxID=262757 RepID=A0A6A1VTN0_9ROSI|nr:hypothetical protein CJ030_MR4G009609 [Morella rubra]